eukprot:gene24638-31006_t
MSSDGIATNTGVSKSNIEKWVSEKVRAQIIAKARSMDSSGLFTTDSITLSGDEAKKESLLDLIAQQAQDATTHNGGKTSGGEENTSVLMVRLLGQSLSAVDVRRSAERAAQPVSSQSSSINRMMPEMPANNAIVRQTSSSSNASNNSANNRSFYEDTSSQGLMDHATSLVNLGQQTSSSFQGPPAITTSANTVNATNKSKSQVPVSNSVAAGKFMDELLEAAKLYQDEGVDGSFSMDLSDVMPHKAKGRALVSQVSRGAVSVVITHSHKGGEGHSLLAGQMPEMFMSAPDIPVSLTRVSDITMSFHSAMVDDTFAPGRVSMGTTTQALRPVLNNTTFLTSFHDNVASSSHIIQDNGERLPPSAREAQDEEDSKVLSLLGEKKFFRAK